MTPAFAKYEGLGNDFVVLDAPGGLLPSADLVRAVCDRHFGVGADGVLVVGPPRSAGARASMTVLNADGSRPEMCGNGLRCVAVHLAAAGGDASFVVDTDAGPRACRVEAGAVEIDMGRLRDEGPIELDLDGEALTFARVSAGNPHAITFAPLGAGALARVGPAVATHPAFPAGTNVELARVEGAGISLVVWERGVGPTLACGTGACATVGAACLAGLAPFDTWVDVALPGGHLAVRVARDDLAATMRGPARRVFAGTLA